MEYGSVIVLLFSIQINDIYSHVKLTGTCNNEKIKKEREKMEKNSSSHIAYRCLLMLETRGIRRTKVRNTLFLCWCLSVPLLS